MIDTLTTLYEKLEGLHKQIDKYKKRLDLWKELPEEDEKKLEELGVEYLETHYKLVDMTFTDNIEPFLYNDEIIHLKQMMNDKYQWTGEIIFDDEYLLNVLKNIEDVDELYSIMDEIETEELKQVQEFLETEAGKEIEYAFGQLILNEEDMDSISKYITSRNKIIKKTYDSYFNFNEIMNILSSVLNGEDNSDK